MINPNGVPMCEYDPLSASPLPQLTDEAAVQILHFLHEVLDRFESRYGDQINRYYDDRSRHNLLNLDPRPSTDDQFF